MPDYGIIDCHAHLHEGNFPPHAINSLETILDNARKANIQTIVSVSENLTDAPKVQDLASRSNGLILAGVGLHPVQISNINNEQVECSVTMDDYEEFLPYLRKCIDNKQICCIGEGILELIATIKFLWYFTTFHV
jgi:Tat protein secretion system quality control protein TatD with DNase activity